MGQEKRIGCFRSTKIAFINVGHEADGTVSRFQLRVVKEKQKYFTTDELPGEKVASREIARLTQMGYEVVAVLRSWVRPLIAV